MLIFLLIFQGLASFSLAVTTLAWGDTKQVNYNTSFPGTGIFWSDPLGKGGMNLSTGKMTNGNDADIAFSLDGSDLGANGIVDLDVVDFKSVVVDQEIGNLTMVDAISGHA
jgi:hypothetical protein